MKLNSKNIFARYYNWIYGELPNDVCSFFWGSLFIVLAFPFVVTGRLLFHDKYDTSFGSCFCGGLFVWFLYGASLGVGIRFQGWYLELENDAYSQFVMSRTAVQFFLVAPLIGATILALIVGTVVLVVYGIIKLSSSDTRKPVILQNTQDFIGAIRKKHCTKIDWE